MSEPDRVNADHAESALSSEPLGIKEPLRSPTALGQAKFLVPLGLRSLSVLQSIAVHSQRDDFDFSTVQAAEPTNFQEPESPPNLQLSGLPEQKNAQSALFEIPERGRFKIPERGRSAKINSLQQKPSPSPKSHPGTAPPRPVQGVVQFFKSVLGRNSSVSEKTSASEFPSVINSPQPISDAPPLIQPQQDNSATLSLQENPVSLADNSQRPIQADYLDAIAPTQLNLENVQESESQKTSSENFLIPSLDTIQLQPEDELEQELPLSFSQNQLHLENLISSSALTVVDTNLENSTRRKDISASKNETVEFPQIQRQSAEQSFIPIQPISSTEIELTTKLALNNEQTIQQESDAQVNKHLSIVQTKNDALESQNQPEFQAKDVETTTLQAKQENSLEQISYSLEADAADQSGSIQSPLPPLPMVPSLPPKMGEVEGQTTIQQHLEVPVENGTEMAIAFIPEVFGSEVEQKEIKQPEIKQPLLQLRREYPSPETSESFLESTVSIEPITSAFPQVQQAEAWREKSVNDPLTSLVGETGAAETLSSTQSNFYNEPAILQRKSDADDFLTNDTSPSNRHVSLIHHDAAFVLNDDASLISHDDVSLSHHSASSINILEDSSTVSESSAQDWDSVEVVEPFSPFIEPETRSLQDNPKESPRSPNASITENLSSSEIQRQLESSGSESQVVSKNFPNIEAGDHLETKILPTSVNDPGVFIEPSRFNSLQMRSEQSSKQFPEQPSEQFPEQFFEQSDELAVASNLHTASTTESFNHYPESFIASSHPGSEPQRLPENILDTPPSQFASDIPTVQTASVSSVRGNEAQNGNEAQGANEAPADFTFIGESISESVESVIDSGSQSSTESAIALSTSTPFINRFPQSNGSESAEFIYPLADPITKSLNIQRRIEPSEPVIQPVTQPVAQNLTLPNNVTLNPAEATSDPAFQSAIEQDDHSSQSSFPTTQQRPSQDLQHSVLDLGSVNFQAESTTEEIRPQLPPSSPALENLSESLPHTIIQLEPHSEGESHYSEPFTSLEASHSGSDIQSLVENSSNALNHSVDNVPTIQTASISSSATSISTHENQENSTHENQENSTHENQENIAAVKINTLDSLASMSDAIANPQKHNTSQNSLPSEDGLEEKSTASYTLNNLDPSPTMARKPEFDIAIQQRPIENIDLSLQFAECKISSQVLPSLPMTENLLSSASAQQPERLEPERPEPDSHAFLESSPDIQLDSETYLQDESLPIEPLSPRSVTSLSSSSIHPGSDIERFTDSKTIAEHENVLSQNSPAIQLKVESRSSTAGSSPETLNEPPFRSSSEAIAHTLVEPAIAFPSSSTEPIINTWSASSSYDSTPNGRRDAQIAASENSLAVESETSPVLSNSLNSDVQRFADDSAEHSSSPAQRGSADQSETVTPLSSKLPSDLPQLPRFLKDLTVLKPLVQRSPLNALPGSFHADTLDEQPLGSSSEAIVQTLVEPVIAFPSPSTEPIINNWSASSSYDSTPNGRRDAQIAASENHLPVESETSPVLSNSLNSDIQRFADDSAEHSSSPAQRGSADQSDAVISSSSKLYSDLPQLPRFLKDLTVLKPLVQRSYLYASSSELSNELSVESDDPLIPVSFQNLSPTFSSPPNENRNSAIQTQPSSNIQLTSAPSAIPSAIPSHPGTVPSAWSSLAELINPKPTQTQQSSPESHYSPLAPSLLQAKFATPFLQKAPDSNAPIEVSNAPTTTLSANDFQPEAQIDALLETLAQEIYGLLRQKMEIERERQGRNLGRMLW